MMADVVPCMTAVALAWLSCMSACSCWDLISELRGASAEQLLLVCSCLLGGGTSQGGCAKGEATGDACIEWSEAVPARSRGLLHEAEARQGVSVMANVLASTPSCWHAEVTPLRSNARLMRF